MAVRRIGAWILTALFVGALTSCLIPRDKVKECTNAQQCDDSLPCTEDKCGVDYTCEHTMLDVPPTNACIPDSPCAKPACNADGACGEVADDSLIPDDFNDCTEDSCKDGKAVHAPKSSDTTCGVGGMLKCEMGVCKCTDAASCGTTTACVTFTCESNACKATSAAKDTLVDSAEQFDCKKNVCDGQGNILLVPDTSDFSADMTPNDCKKPGCKPDGTPEIAYDLNDLPLDDMNPCTEQGCNTDGSISTSNLPDGMACGAAQTCVSDGGTGFHVVSQPTCMAGVCASMNPTSCGLYTCNGADCRTNCQNDGHCIAGNYCDLAMSACKPKTDNGGMCTGGVQCKSGFCVDGVCCNSACGGTCESCALPGKVGACNKVAFGDDPAMECPGGGACNGAGVCIKAQGDPCGNDNECLGGNCEEGICCNNTCSGVCARCDIVAGGICTNVPVGQQVFMCTGNSACDGNNVCKKANGQGCGNGGECATGNCVDGYCCDNVCTGLCRSCKGSETVGGVNGKCDFIKNGQDPIDECSGGGNTCDGMGMCQ